MNPARELLRNKRIYVAGHRGMVGAAVCRRLAPTAEIISRNSTELDLRNQAATHRFFEESKPECVVFCAARVGGIHANHTYPAPFIYDNLMMAANAIHAAYETGVERFLFLGSTCIYPRECEQPIHESALLTGPLETTNEAYAIAKIAGLKMCQFYRQQYGVLYHSLMPTNLYGPGDNYHPQNSHVLPALLRRFHEAHQTGQEKVTIWGSGQPRRDFLHVDDLASAVELLLCTESPPDWVNAGSGSDVSILELAEIIAATVGFNGDIQTDPTRPDGTRLKRADIEQIQQLGWHPQIPLREGIQRTYDDFLAENSADALRAV